jgi:hypothetical protein
MMGALSPSASVWETVGFVTFVLPSMSPLRLHSTPGSVAEQPTVLRPFASNCASRRSDLEA